MSITVSQLIGRVTIEGAAASAGQLIGLGRAADAAGAQFGRLALIGAGVLVAGLIAIGVKSTEMAANFQQGVNRLRTGAGDMQDSFASLSSGILGVSVSTGVMTDKLLPAMYLILSSGQRGAQAYDTLAVAARGAVIEQANVADVANVVSGLMTNYGTKVFGATQYMNGLIYAVAHGKITLQDLATAMGPIDPIAQHLGISMADVAAAMTTQTNAMIPAARAATGLRFMMSALENPTAKANDAMKNLGLSSVDVANEMKVSLPGALQMIVDAALKVGPEGSVPFNRAVGDMVGGIRGLSAFLALTGTHMADFVANSAGISAVMRSGATDVNGWAIAQQNLNVQMDRVKAAGAALAISFGALLIPMLTNLLSAVVPVITAFTGWVTSSNGLVGMVRGIGDAFKNLFDPVQKVQQAAKPLTDTFDRASGIFQKVWQQLTPLRETFDKTKGAVMGVEQVVKPMTDTFDRASSILAPLAGHVKAAHDAFQPLIPILAGVGTVITVLLEPSLETLAVGMWTALWPALAIGAAVAGLVVIFMHFYQTNAGFKSFIDNLVSGFKTVAGFIVANFIPAIKDVGTWLGVHVLPILKDIGAFLLSTFTPVWKQLVEMWQTQIVPMLKQLWDALQPLMPALKALGGLILAAIVVALGLAVGAIGGILKGLSYFLEGVARAVSGIVQVFTGIVQVVSGIVRFIYDLVTGNFKNLGNDLKGIWLGIENIFSGAWKIIEGIFQAAWGAISGFVGGLVQGVIGFFQTLFNALVGHSIIPDMINAIVGVFASLPGRIFGAIGSLAGNLASFFGGLARNALTWGWNIIQNLAGGIINGIWSSLGNAMGAIGQFIHDHLPASPAKIGPLRDLARQGAQIPEQIAQGIMSGIPKLQPSLNLALTPRMNYTPLGFTGGGASSSSSSATPTQINLQIDGYTLGRILLPYQVQSIRNNLGITNL